jgi:hypothetical protein
MYQLFLVSGNYFIEFAKVRNPDKETIERIRCENKNYYYFVMIVVICLYLNEVFKKLVLFLNPKLPRYGRYLIGFQIMAAAYLLLITSTFIMLLDEFNEMLINVGSLVIINEFDNIMGKIFLMHLTTFHREIISQDDFLVFDGAEQ